MAEPIRLEPRTRGTAASDDAVQMRVHDPLWLLARQWQFGAFRGSDGGSPARTDLAFDAAPLSRFCEGAPTPAARPYDPAAAPLETLVERETALPRLARPPGHAVEAGAHFLRLLAAHGAGRHVAAYRHRYALSPAAPEALRGSDPEGARTLALAAGRVPDGVRLFADLSAAFGVEGERAGALPAEPAIPAADRPAVMAAVRAWLRWYHGQGAAVGDEGALRSWSPTRMEHRFAVGGATAREEIVLSAPEYAGGRLDWHAFVTAPGASLGAPVSGATPVARTVLPTPVTYRGMPAARLWQMEDGAVQLAGVEADSTAARLLLEFALVYGDDWFLVPLELDVGTICRVTSLVVTDSFGVRTAIRHASAVDGPGAPWSMFALSPGPSAPAGAARPADVLLLAPVLGPALTGPPLEDVLLVRDEMANLAWAVERLVTGAAGTPIDRVEAHSTRTREEEPPAFAGAAVRYRLASQVPEHWIPLVPEPGEGGLRLRAAGGGRGRLLERAGDLRLYEEEVPREGARVVRAYQFARWIDGTGHLWEARRKTPGHGEGSSGLRFDYTEPV